MSPDYPIDRVYVAASSRDARLTRICVASIRYFYKDLPICLLVGGPLQPGLEEELARYWNVGRADLPEGDYGWGFVKLEPLFRAPGERFLVLDSDTAFCGPALDIARDCAAPFIVDDETQSPEDLVRLYYDWQKVRAVDPAAREPAFVFNSGQWFGTSGIVTRDDFGAMLEWSMPPRLRHPRLFMPGDQGVLNYVLNQKSGQGLDVARRAVMRWPGHVMAGITVASVSNRTAPPAVVHWAGLKKPRLGDMPSAGLLLFFEKAYYARIPFGGILRPWRAMTDVLSQWLRKKSARFRGLLQPSQGET